MPKTTPGMAAGRIATKSSIHRPGNTFRETKYEARMDRTELTVAATAAKTRL
jgi:hypothetical protein